MKFVYTTDLHGSIKKYQDVLRFAEEQEVDLIHLGADLLPKGSGILKTQKKFIKGFLKNFYIECHDKGIKVLGFFGNDDLYTRKKYFREYATLLDEVPYEKDGFKFTAYPYVPDYPFGLKSACKIDHTGWKMQGFYLTDPVDVSSEGFIPINDVERYFAEKGTIEDDLKMFPGDSNTIAAIHCPPQGLGLDVCMDGRRVGSKAVTEWIERVQPALVLCGHIHESFEVTDTWSGDIGRTRVIQPGQSSGWTNIVLVTVGTEIEAQIVTLP